MRQTMRRRDVRASARHDPARRGRVAGDRLRIRGANREWIPRSSLRPCPCHTDLELRVRGLLRRLVEPALRVPLARSLHDSSRVGTTCRHTVRRSALSRRAAPRRDTAERRADRDLPRRRACGSRRFLPCRRACRRSSSPVRRELGGIRSDLPRPWGVHRRAPTQLGSTGDPGGSPGVELDVLRRRGSVGHSPRPSRRPGRRLGTMTLRRCA